MKNIRSSAKPFIGLVGGIGAGKSRVAVAFAKHGGRVIAADTIGHEALRQPDIRAQLVAQWGSGIIGPDGEIDRRRVGAIVFADPAERKTLEALVHPWIGRRLREEIDKAQADPTVPFVVLDAAVMLEAGWNGVCSKLVYVHAPRDLRLKRLAQSRGWTEAEVAAREQAQLPPEAKAALADATIDNTGPLEALDRAVADLVEQWGLEKRPGTPVGRQ